MADELNDFDTVSLDQLDTISLTVDSLMAIANINGKLYKSKISDFINYITPFLATVSASNFAPVSGNVLPNNTSSPSQFTLVGAGTFTQTTGGNITTTALLNILGWNGTSWSLIKGIDTSAFLNKSEYIFGGTYATLADANTAITNTVVNGKNKRDGKRVDIGTSGSYIQYWWKGGFEDVNLTEIAELKAVRTAGGRVDFVDSNGNVAMAITSMGEVAIAKFNSKTTSRILTDLISVFPLNVSTEPGGAFKFKDAAGNTSFYINSNGEIGVAKFTGKTEDRIKALFGGKADDHLKGKKISILGDSISTPSGNAGLVYPQQYYAKLETEQACTLFINAIAGTTITVGGTGTAMSDPTRWQTMNSVFTPDVDITFAGINDFLQNMPLGTPNDTVNTTFYGALDYMYKGKMTRCPNTKFLHMTPLHTTYSQGGGLVPEYNGTRYLTEYIEAILVVARRYGIGVVDTNRNSGITCFNVATLTVDNIHPKAIGHQMIYNTLIRETNFLL